MANTYIYDIDTRLFITEQGLSVATVPAIHFGTKPVWNILLRHKDGSIPNLSSVVAFRAAIDTDFNDSTQPICRTISGITFNPATGLLSVPLDAATSNFRTRCNGRETTPGYFEVHGSDSNGTDVFYILFRVACNYVIDPDGDSALDPITGDAMTSEQVAAIAAQVLQEQAETIRGPQGDPAPATLIQFSANATSWHSGWSAGDLFVRFSTNNGTTWQECQFTPATGILPVIVDWENDAIYPAGTLVRHGTPTCIYQATVRVTDFTEPGSDGDTSWTLVCQGQQGATGEAGATWLTGTGAPSQYNTAGAVGDHYLDLSTYNHYLCTAVTTGATPVYTWTQKGSLKGRDGTGINYRGEWDEDSSYAIGDAVTYYGSLWRAFAANTETPPPSNYIGASPCWEIFVAAIPGAIGEAGTIEIASVIVESPQNSPWAQELNYSTPAHRVYALHIPRGSAGPAGRTTFTVNAQPSTDGKVYLTEQSGSTPSNRIYQLRLPRGIQGEEGKGLQIDAIGPLAGRAAYNGLQVGQTFLATDIVDDDNGLHYQRLYVKTASGWSDPVRLYMGAPGPQGPQGEQGPQGPYGLAPATDDYEFAADNLVANALYLDGDTPIASVDLIDEDGNYNVLHPGVDYTVKTSLELGKTIVSFGSSTTLDFTYGGRVRYAQGKVSDAINLVNVDTMATVSATSAASVTLTPEAPAVIDWSPHTATVTSGGIAVSGTDLYDGTYEDMGAANNAPTGETPHWYYCSSIGYKIEPAKKTDTVDEYQWFIQFGYQPYPSGYYTDGGATEFAADYVADLASASWVKGIGAYQEEALASEGEGTYNGNLPVLSAGTQTIISYDGTLAIGSGFSAGIEYYFRLNLHAQSNATLTLASGLSFDNFKGAQDAVQGGCVNEMLVSLRNTGGIVSVINVKE